MTRTAQGEAVFDNGAKVRMFFEARDVMRVHLSAYVAAAAFAAGVVVALFHGTRPLLHHTERARVGNTALPSVATLATLRVAEREPVRFAFRLATERGGDLGARRVGLMPPVVRRNISPRGERMRPTLVHPAAAAFGSAATKALTEDGGFVTAIATTTPSRAVTAGTGIGND